MKLLIDDAHIDLIKEIYEYYPLDGVTTNPSILAKCGEEPFKLLKEIRQLIGDTAQLHVQAVADTAEGMVEDAHRITRELGADTYVKIPAIKEGFKAMKILAEEGIHVTATAVYTPMQGFLAGKCGAAYVAPYINRIDNMGYNGIGVAKQIHDILKNNHMETEVIAASFKNTQQVLELCVYGVGAATVAPDVIQGFVKNREIMAAVDDFVKDFEGLTGKGKTMNTL